MRPEPAPEFANMYTSSRLISDLLPVLEDIAAKEFRAVVMGNPDIDEDDIKDMETSVRMIEAIIGGSLRSQKKMYIEYGRKVSALMGCNSNEELDQAVNALLRE